MSIRNNLKKLNKCKYGNISFCSGYNRRRGVVVPGLCVSRHGSPYYQHSGDNYRNYSGQLFTRNKKCSTEFAIAIANEDNKSCYATVLHNNITLVYSRLWCYVYIHLLCYNKSKYYIKRNWY